MLLKQDGSDGCSINRIKAFGKKIKIKSNENIHKKEDGSYYIFSANKPSSMTL